MKASDIQSGDIVVIDYITEFTKEHINKGKALVLWKGYNNQPLVLYFSDLEKGKYRPSWEVYEYISKVIGHYNIVDNIKDRLQKFWRITKDL